LYQPSEIFSYTHCSQKLLTDFISGNVGLSLGQPDVMTSLSGQFTIFSKLVICVMMIRGRHRGPPYALDRAVLLPSPNNQSSDESELNQAVVEKEKQGLSIGKAQPA
jgi:hypothetical protein